MSDEPKPWLQGGAPPGVSKLLESAGSDGPSAAAFAKLSAKLAAAGLLAPSGAGGGGGHGGGGDGGGGATHAPTHGADPAASHATSHAVSQAAPQVAAKTVASTAASVAKPVALGAKMLLIGSVGVAAVGGGAFQAGRVVERHAQEQRHAEEQRLAQAAPVQAPPAVVAAPTPPPPPPAEEPQAEVVPEPVLPPKPAVRPKAVEPPSPEQEAELLTRALAASQQAQWSDALQAAELHARRFPNGSLAQEREMIAIESLLKLSRRSEAERRAAKFRQQWPTSTHLVRLNTLLKE